MTETVPAVFFLFFFILILFYLSLKSETVTERRKEKKEHLYEFFFLKLRIPFVQIILLHFSNQITRETHLAVLWSKIFLQDVIILK